MQETEKRLFFPVSGCKKGCYYVIFNGWIRRSLHSAESIEERYETLLRSVVFLLRPVNFYWENCLVGQFSLCIVIHRQLQSMLD